jgi:hypothetical protein
MTGLIRASACDMKCTRHEPFNVVGEAGQNLIMIGLIEAIDVLLYGFLVQAHEVHLATTLSRSKIRHPGCQLPAQAMTRALGL